MYMQARLVNVGKSKAFYESDHDTYIMHFLDNVSSLTANKNARIPGTGIVRSIICETLMKELEKSGIHTHYLSTIKPGEIEVKQLDMFKLEIIPRNYAAGSVCERFPVTRGFKFDPPVLKLDMKYKEDPMLNTDYAVALGIATKEELKKIRELAFAVNSVLTRYFYDRDLILVDFKIEMGRDGNDNIIIGDEISCDGLRAWDKTTAKAIDKDVFRYGWADLLETYKELASRLVPGFSNTEELTFFYD